jgi:DNA-binding NtrC family response regulator
MMESEVRSSGAVFVEFVEAGQRRRFLLPPQVEIFVGTNESCALRVIDSTVSRQHASLFLNQNSILVKDFESRNGTKFLGAKIKSASVPIGGQISVGQLVLTFLSASNEKVSEKEELAGVIGSSRAMRKMFAEIEKLAPSHVNVLITGESGTGKDKIANAMHSLSNGAANPFVVFDCAAVTPTLVESELFGHVKGAFTGAIGDKLGALELARDGTLFIDEVGELPLDLQPKLLRALEAREFSRVGENKTRPFKARVLAATHRDLQKSIDEKRFRLDLYFRLAVTSIHVPPLRERREDIGPLVKAFAKEFSGREVKLSAELLAGFQSQEWRGNVRELRNAVQRALALGRHQHTTDATTTESEEDGGLGASKNRVVERFEREYLVALLEQHGNNFSEVARQAQIARSQLYRLLEKHKLGSYGESP